jgi:LruC domain-containing protein
LDGALMNSIPKTGNLKSSTADFLIGSQNSENFFSGQLDEAMIFDKALTQEDVSYLFANNYNPSNGNASLVAHWPLDAISAGKVVDIIGGFNATATDISAAPGMVEGSMNFNGSSSSAIAPHHPNINPTTAFTMMAWVNTRENKTAKVVQKGDYDGHGIGQDVWLGWNAHIRGSDQNTHDILWGEGRPVLNTWYHLTVTYDGSVLKLYVNGQFKNARKLDIPLNSNSRPFSIGSDNGRQKYFNGLIDDVKYYSEALSAIEIKTAMSEAPEIADADGDGIPDEEDDFPNDPARAFLNHFPASGFGSLAFEDLWPGKGDYDFNDLVVDYRFNMITNQANKITEIEAVFAVRANGAGLRNGFGFQLPGDIPTSDFEVSGYRLEENYINLNENGTESGQQIPTIIVFDNIKNILQSDAGFGANVVPGLPYIEPDTIKIALLLKPNTYMLSDFQPENFNPFLIVDMERGKEIHLPDYAPTSLVDRSYFGQMDDNSDPANGRYYKTETQLPWAINIIESFDYTNEHAQVTQGHLRFADWAESGGDLYPDWFKNKSGYRSAAHIYVVP